MEVDGVWGSGGGVGRKRRGRWRRKGPKKKEKGGREADLAKDEWEEEQEREGRGNTYKQR